MPVKLAEDFGQVDVLSAMASDNYRISFSRFGTRPRNFFIGRSVPWKGLRKAEGEILKDYLARLKKVNAKVAAGLESAIKFSTETAKGVTGVALVKINGVRKVMPQRSYELALAAGKKAVELIRAYEAAAQIPPAELLA